MYITPVSNNYPKPTFQANALRKTKCAVEYIDCALQRDIPPPAIFRQYLPVALEHETAPLEMLTLASNNPAKDLKDIYGLYQNDFNRYFNYMSYKRFKNNLHYDNATVFMIKNSEETVGFYSVAQKDKDTLYVCDIDLNPKYRNTRMGKNVLLTCWDNITKIAKENQCSKIGLHVDAGKRPLVSLYKKFGFNIVENKTDKYSTGLKAYYMEREV